MEIFLNSNTTLVKVKSTDTKRQEKFFTIQIQHLLKLNQQKAVAELAKYPDSNTTLVKVKC